MAIVTYVLFPVCLIAEVIFGVLYLSANHPKNNKYGLTAADARNGSNEARMKNVKNFRAEIIDEIERSIRNAMELAKNETIVTLDNLYKYGTQEEVKSCISDIDKYLTSRGFKYKLEDALLSHWIKISW